MAIQNMTVAQQMGRQLAELVKDEPTIKQLWALGEKGRVYPERETVDLWIFLDSADDVTEDRIVAAATGLGSRFEEADTVVHVTNGELPAGFDPLTEVYPGAEQIPLSAR